MSAGVPRKSSEPTEVTARRYSAEASFETTYRTDKPTAPLRVINGYNSRFRFSAEETTVGICINHAEGF